MFSVQCRLHANDILHFWSIYQYTSSETSNANSIANIYSTIDNAM